MNNPLMELSVSRLPRSSGPILPGESSKALGVAASAGPELLVTLLKAIVGRVLSSWIGANEASWESTTTWPPPKEIEAWLTELTNAFFEGASESARNTRPPHWPPVAFGPTPSESPPTLSSWYDVKTALLPGTPSTWSEAPARDVPASGDELPTSTMAARSLKIAPASIIAVTPLGTTNVEPSASGRFASVVPMR